MQEVNVNDLLNEAMTRKPDGAPFWRTEFEAFARERIDHFSTLSRTSHDDARRKIFLGANHADHAKQ
jgi:hypothetical protein